MLLHEAGLIEATNVSSHDGVCWRPKYLTYAGNEFLAAAESDTVWHKAKSIVWAGTKTVTLEALKHALPLAMKALMPGASLSVSARCFALVSGPVVASGSAAARSFVRVIQSCGSARLPPDATRRARVAR